MPLKNQSGREPSRRLPVQTRSQHTVQRVLDSASSLLEQLPLEDVTTTRIAAEAGLSIGGLYRFFPDKQSIIDAIAVRHVEQFRSSLEETVMTALEREFADLSTFDPSKLLNRVVDAYVAYLDAHPDFRTISFGRHISAATKEREASPQVGLPALLKNFHAGAAGHSQYARAGLDAARRKRSRRAPDRLRLRTAHARRPRPHHRRDETHAGQLSVPVRATAYQLTIPFTAVLLTGRLGCLLASW